MAVIVGVVRIWMARIGVVRIKMAKIALAMVEKKQKKKK
jgi:hypothetical protein